jgi:uncharacterized protein (DUF1501 family)
MSNQTDKQRREFLKKFGVLAGGTTLLATQSKLQLIKSALAVNYSAINDQKSLVCIFLAGGNDSFNLFAPYQSDLYSTYSAIRGEVAIPRADLAGQQVEDGSGYAFHNRAAGIAESYNDGNIALISNVGNLRQPLTRQQYLNRDSGAGILIPEHLFAHDVQQATWQTNRPPGIPVPAGWGGQLADLLDQANTGSNLRPAFSLSGSNAWQSGRTTQPFSLSSTGVNLFNQLQAENLNGADRNSIRARIWNEILGLDREHVLERHAAGSFLTAQERLLVIRDALNSSAATNQNVSAFNGLGGNRLAQDLQMIARLIATRNDLNQRRQIFFVRYGGWDTHKGQLLTHNGLLGTLNDAMLAFQSTMEGLGTHNSVTTFTASEFGRTATSNNGGTDHGWGGHQLVMGGAVNGGQIHGTLPNLQPGGEDDTDNSGRIIPTLSVDQYGATLARWMGLEDSDLNAIFPNLHMFNQRDLGFMS